jgi:hypothetical protein
MWANFRTIIELFIKKIVNKLLKIWSWDPGSGIRDPGSGKKPILYPGVKKAPDPGSGSATLILELLSLVRELQVRIMSPASGWLASTGTVPNTHTYIS